MLEIDNVDLQAVHILWPSILNVVSKEEALKILEEVKENVNICCAITMEPDEVLYLLDKLEDYINETTDN